ncbi:MAG: hypothetical protein ACKVQC_07030 [Elusimicrobiota bacterium]
MKNIIFYLFIWSLIYPIKSLIAQENIPIEIRVEVSEIDQVKAAQLGIDWFHRIGFEESQPVKLLALNSIDRLTALRGDVDFLVQEGAAELLANPNLVTNSGSQATFRAGGEIPYITSNSLGTSNVEFKPFGVGLEIKPVLTEDGQINMQVKASVSAPDSSNTVSLSGNSVPGLLEREVTSQVTVAPGTTMTLAGLVQTQKTLVNRGVPILRKIPLLGFLFRWKREERRKTSIIVFVTPRIVEFSLGE